MGSLVQHGRDASGQYYRRNRYYDATTGRFTQEDPIGLAGGINLYGYANGNPVGYSDPYGLSADTLKAFGDAAEDALGGIAITLAFALQSSNAEIRGAAEWLVARLDEMNADGVMNAYLEVRPRRGGESGAGPCRGALSGAVCGSVNTRWQNHRNVGVQALHEIGHLYAYAVKGHREPPANWIATDPSNDWALAFENAMRTIQGCGARAHHQVYMREQRESQNPSCFPQK
jgi:RHS repeat-associated protein